MKFGVVFRSIPPHGDSRVNAVWEPRGGVRGGVLYISTRCSEDSEDWKDNLGDSRELSDKYVRKERIGETKHENSDE